jgi:hypothetical protein
VATWFWQMEGKSAEHVILGVRPSEFILLEFQSPSRRIFIGSHSLPPPLRSPNQSFTFPPPTTVVKAEVLDPVPASSAVGTHREAVAPIKRGRCSLPEEELHHRRAPWMSAPPSFHLRVPPLPNNHQGPLLAPTGVERAAHSLALAESSPEPKL